VTRLSPLRAEATGRIRAVLADAYPLPLSTGQVEERTGYGARYGQLAYRMLARLAARRDVEKICMPDARSRYWRMWPQDTGPEPQDTSTTRNLGGQTVELLRDEAGESVRELVTRNRDGRFCTPRCGFIWTEQASPEPAAPGTQATAEAGLNDIEAG
jgi:hypothetical protein